LHFSGGIELNDVKVSNENQNPYEIMANVKANLHQLKALDAFKRRNFFIDNLSYFKPKLLKLKSSTGFTSKQKRNNDLKKKFSNI
jgi:hypothetical protein